MPPVKRRALHLSIIGLLALLAVALVGLAWHDPLPELAASPTPATAIPSNEPLLPLPPRQPPAHPARVALGQRLFHEPLLSRDRTLACASCHNLSLGGTDRRPRSIGTGGALGQLNSPSVLNVALNFAQFWDGRAETLEAQVAGPLHNPVEMASNWAEAISRLRAQPEYRQAFALAYAGEGISETTIADALASFERSLLPVDSPFDRYLRGDRDAIDPDAREGYTRFKALGCASCHQGAGIGGNMFQRFGVMGDYFGARGDITVADLGRYNVTGRDADRHVFKVPSLRNVALTAPYFHDGNAATLDEAVAIMGRYQLGLELSAEDRRLIIAFLDTLTGQPPALAPAEPRR
ncbi:putative cytochrome C peroxidase [Azoarcus olearius]|uniref:cytochrome-c peroxidase n=1 Tax=Azoarcus sp. (strain BH72) TaxID=418699 RepID=UPI0008061213|nr:cytochrome-c peroxidase [Azoarcus olearius]ANQ84447.1 putative cytochrome C peroxidase [Azoarcus olearius]